MADSPQDFRARRMQERARRIAQRAVAAGGLQKLQATAMVSLDAICAPGPQWKAPEPPLESPGGVQLISVPEE